MLWDKTAKQANLKECIKVLLNHKSTPKTFRKAALAIIDKTYKYEWDIAGALYKEFYSLSNEIKLDKTEQYTVEILLSFIHKKCIEKAQEAAPTNDEKVQTISSKPLVY